MSDENRTVPDEPAAAETPGAGERSQQGELCASAPSDRVAAGADAPGEGESAAPDTGEGPLETEYRSSGSPGPAEVEQEEEAGQAVGEPLPAEQGEQAAGEPPPAASGGSKRKRKKKRKQTGDTAEAAEKGAEDRDGKAKDASHLPFIRFLSGGGAGKRHFFAVGEIVAGRVVRGEGGSIVVDLFGKATAIADELEPREIQFPEKVEERSASAPAAGEPAAEGATGERERLADDAGSQDREQEPVEEQPVVTDRASPASDGLQPPQTGEEPAAGGEGEVAAASPPADSAGEEQEPPGAGEEAEQTAGPGRDVKGEDQVEGGSPPPPPLQPGSIFRGRIGAIAESGHVGIVNRWVDPAAARARIEKLREQRKRVPGVVFGFNRGGFDVLVEGIRAFCPASGMSLEEINDPRQYIAQKLEFTLPAAKGSSEAKDLVVSRRSILEKENRKRVKELLRSLQPGQKIRGKVTQIREYGLFVDIGGVDGLVHQSELSYAFGVKPQEVAQVGDEVDVQVIRVGSDGESAKERVTRVNLSIKALLPDPWDTHADAIAEGSVQKGRVTRTTEFGAFIELAPSVEGLLHVTELGRELKHASQAVKEGDEIHVVVERADRRTRRISLSKLSAQAAREFEEGKLEEVGKRPPSLQPGARVKVKLESADHRGLVVRVVGAAGKRGRGYVPGSETGKERGTDLRKAFPAGSELEVKILGVDRDGGLKCSVKALAIDDERRAVREYRREAAKQGFGTFGDLLRAKLGDASRE